MTPIPAGVSQLLSSVVRRVRLVRAIRGVAVTGIAWFAAVAVAMAVDARFAIFDDRLRWTVSGLIALVALLAATFAVVVPLRRRLDFRKAAKTLDAHHPEFEERFSTLVELSDADPTKAGFSPSLFAVVCNRTEDDASKLDLAREVPLAGAMRWLGALFLLLLALAVGIIRSPNRIGLLFVRAVAPWVDVGNLFADEIAVKPGDLVALAGTVIRIEAAPTIRRSDAPANRESEKFTIRISRKTRRGWSEETTEPMANGVYETTADLSEREWRYRVNAGPAVTRHYRVRVSEMPQYDLFRATVRYPDYTGLAPLVLTNEEVRAVKAVAGSRVNFEVKVSEPGTAVDFRIGGEPVTEYLMVSNVTANGSLDLVNADGFRAEKGRFTLASFVDQPPSVVIEKPTGTLRLPPHAKIPVEITATDDIAVTSVCLRVSIDGGPWKLPAGGALELKGDRRFVRHVADVDLSLYDLVFAKSVRFDVVVDDACPPEFGGPHSATSMPFTVQFAENEANYGMRELKKEVASARQDIDEARRRLNDAQRLARQVRDELRRSGKTTESAERNGERMAHELDEAKKRIEGLRNRFAEDERFEPLTRPMDRLLDKILKPALEAVENAPFREKEERGDEVDKAISAMEKAVRELDELAKRLAERAEKVDRFEKVKDLAARQEALAKSAREILKEHPTDTAMLEAWKRLEETAMRKTEELARQKPDPDFAEARRKMETAAREMADLKRALDAAKQTTDASKREAERERRARSEADAQNRELRQAVNDQKRATEALKNAAARRADEARFRAAKNAGAADQKAREAENCERQAAEAQRSTEDRLERGGALDGVKALQREATQAAWAARQTPQTVGMPAAALAAQQAATEALERELAVREGIRKGELAADDLAMLNGRLKEGLLAEASARTKAAETKAAEALAAAKKAIGSDEWGAIDRLAAAALETRRDAVGAQRRESGLRGTSERTEALRAEENALEAMETTAAEASELEKKILSLQQSAAEALERNDRGRAMNLQREIARAQARAAESLGEAKDASQPQPSASTSVPHPPTSNLQPAEAAEAASDALKREVEAQAASLGMSARPGTGPAYPGTGPVRLGTGPAYLGTGPEKGSFSRSGWFKIRNVSQEGLRERDLRDVPREYRDLVRRYFLKLSEEQP